MCRAPEIVAVGEPVVMPDGSEYQAHRCVNCDRWAHECPICREVRCDHDLHMSMIGSIPLACKVCRPDGIRQIMTLGTGRGFGPYREGTVVEVVDDPEVRGFTLG